MHQLHDYQMFSVVHFRFKSYFYTNLVIIFIISASLYTANLFYKSCAE